MDSKSKLQYQTLMATQDPSKYILMEDLRPKVDAEEKSTGFINPTFLQTIFSHGTSTQSSIKDGKIGMPEGRTKVALVKSVTAVVIMIVIAILLVPIIIYYTLKSDSPLPESNSVLGDVNISMSDLYGCPNTTIQDSSCTEDVIYTYESLKVASALTNEFCAKRTYLVFCEALNFCSISNDTAARSLLCTLVRQQYCTAEWRIMEVNNRSEYLIDCDGFGETGKPSCIEQFDLADGDSVCLPLCKEFSQYDEKFTDTIVALNAFVHLVNVLGGVVSFFACIVNRKKMFKFPQILILVNICMLTCASFMTMISNISLGSWNPICSERFLTSHLSIDGALDNPSAFCEIQGMIVFAGFVMYSVYWLLYAFHLYMKVAHPDYSMLFDNWHRTKKFYYFEIGFFTLIGTLPYLILASLSEFKIASFPPQHCTLSAEGNFYGFIFPTIAVNCTTLILLLLVLYHVHMHMGIFKKSDGWLCQFTAPEVKIFIIFCYMLTTFAALWINFTNEISKSGEYSFQLGKYIGCSINGVHDLDCEQYREAFERFTIQWLLVFHLVLVAFINLSMLPLIIEYKSVKDMIISKLRPTLGRDTVKETELPSHTVKRVN